MTLPATASAGTAEDAAPLFTTLDGLSVGAANGDGVATDSTRTVVLLCEGTISGVFGGSQECSRSVSMGFFDDSISHSIAVTWAFLASGSQTWAIRDPVGDYLVGGCVATSPAITSSDISCENVLLRSFVFIGTHTDKVTQTYDLCLLLSCGWEHENTVTITS